MTLENWLNRVDELKKKKNYRNRFLGTPKFDTGIDRFYYAGLTPQKALIAWRDYRKGE